ncbi:hypothetical protein CspeluHIS016_0205520 [Cutaneotrichosporon spelunceum]|uniref:DUF7719 domain-containing protein n=1 Tax=Cutaneotrichosporon spelunceum TaxID=1672016 RepID=A0AAD3TRB0_9TREE|nr:hypothetical protein CspeluHIS016_0205520 [Cutaneotrichosporon spelunceum]
MARLDAINPEPPRQRKGKKGKRGDTKLFIRPSEIAGGGKPLIDLDEDDLRAAGVTFTEGGMEDLPAPVVMDPSPEEEEEEDDRTTEERAVEAWWDEFFDSMVYTIPFSFLFLLLDILSNQTYAVERRPIYYFKNYAFALLTLGVIVFYTNRHIGKSKLCQFLVTVASIAASTRVIWLINRASYLMVMEQGPACGTIWIASIVMLPLGRALLALAAWYGYVWYNNFSISP